MADLTADLDKIGTGRNFARGKAMYAAAQCLQCHQFGPERGGNIGPDITAVGNRFNRHDLLESIIHPSKAISEQYASYVLNLKDGEFIIGQIVAENANAYTIVTDAVTGAREEIPKNKVTSREISPVSLMPPGLLNTLSKEEILDLLAYLESGGNEKAAMFTAK
jgi:putative heme-binding domain-containing protein